MHSRSSRRGRLARVILLVLGAAAAMALAAPTLEGGAVRDFGGPASAPVAIAFFSGDMGFRFGMSGKVGKGLAARAIPVIGFSSPRYFGQHRSRAEADRIVADAVRLTLARTGAQRVVLMGQSYGADIVATTAPDLPPDLRARLAAVAMIVPAQTVYFRADPLGFAYHGEPDARPLDALLRFDSAPLVCIYGLEEKDSLCPPLTGTGIHVAGLPGGHFLHHDADRLLVTLVTQLQAADPTIMAEPSRWQSGGGG